MVRQKTMPVLLYDIKNARSAEWHSLPPPFPVALPYIHNTTSQVSAAITVVEHDAITQNNNTDSMTFFISATVMINERLHIFGYVVCQSYFLNTSFMLFK